MCSPAPRPPDILDLRPSGIIRQGFPEPPTQREPLVEHKARMEREHAAAMRENRRGLYLLGALLVTIIVGALQLLGLL